ncbi:hypothetical protein ACFFQF_14015 [Haladaptatus pallidirubidus]|nr:hypothetical protein [Haladaptatus pallidirubidus]
MTAFSYSDHVLLTTSHSIPSAKSFDADAIEFVDESLAHKVG